MIRSTGATARARVGARLGEAGRCCIGLLVCAVLCASLRCSYLIDDRTLDKGDCYYQGPLGLLVIFPPQTPEQRAAFDANVVLAVAATQLCLEQVNRQIKPVYE